MVAPPGDRSAYLVAPEAGSGPGVLVLHSWWGATAGFRRLADRLADEGFVALVPDLQLGARPRDPAEAEAVLAGADPNRVADLVVSSAATLRNLAITPDGPIGVVGFSMGASWALWLASRHPALVGAVSAFYGGQDLGYEHSEAVFQLHFAEHDDYVSEDEVVLTEASLLLDGHEVESHRYPGAGHWFMEEDRPEAFHAEAASLAWTRTLTFLRAALVRPA